MLSPVNPNKTAYFAIATPNTVAYLLAKLPVGLIELYAVSLWIGGLVNPSYPLWWGAFPNHPPGAPLRPRPGFTPLRGVGEGPVRRPAPPRPLPPAPRGA